MKEFYWNTGRNMLICEDLSTGDITQFSALGRSFLIEADARIRDNYPDVYAELCQWIGDGPGKEYGRVYQFCSCNFSQKDGLPDVDDDFNFITEVVSCPVRHQCRWHICRPVLTRSLSCREIEVIRLFVKFTEEEIADRLFISPATVHNHITRIYQKLGFSGPTAPKQLVEYAYKSKIITI